MQLKAKDDLLAAYAYAQAEDRYKMGSEIKHLRAQFDERKARNVDLERQAHELGHEF